MESTQPFLEKRASSSRPPAADASFFERELGTSTQRAFFFMLLASVVDFAQRAQNALMSPHAHIGARSLSNDTSAASVGDNASGIGDNASITSPLMDAQHMVLGIDSFTSLFSSFLMFVGAAIYLYAMHPSRMMLSVGYKGGASKEPVPNTFWNRHFGTEMLVAGQVQLAAVLIYIVSGTAQVIIADDAVAESRGLLAMILTSKDDLGYENTLIGLAGSWATYVLNRTSYPGRMSDPESIYCKWLSKPCALKFFRQSTINWLKVRLMNDNLVISWLLLFGSAIWLYSAFDGSMLDASAWLSLDVAQPALYFCSGLCMLHFAYNEGTMLDPVLFGCHRSSTLPTNHPMGPMFNARFIDGVDVDAGIDAALKVLELPWTEHAEGVWLNEDGDMTAMKVELEVGLHPFALAQIFHSEDAKREEAACDGVEIVEKLSDNAEVFYTSNCAEPPMPRSDQVFVSALREPVEEGGPVVVAEWAVCHAKRPEKNRVVRECPFTVVHLDPIGPASTKVTIVIVTSVACWMPKLLVRDGLDSGAKQLFEMRALPESKDGRELIAGIEGAIWSSVAQEGVPPCLWDFYAAVAPGIAKLPIDIVRKPWVNVLPKVVAPQNPCDVLGRSPEVDPLMAAATALAFANADTWTEVRGIAKRMTERGQSLCRHKHLAGAVRASTRVLDIHPALLGLMLNSAEFKRSSDQSIVELREIQKVSDQCSVWYQRSRLGKMLHERDSVYASLLVDASPDQVLLIEWPVEAGGCPAEGLCARRAKSFFCYEVKKVRGGHSQLTVTAVVDMGGALGSRFLRPVVDRTAAGGLFEGLVEMAGFFRTEEGRSAKAEMEREVQKGIVGSLRPELSHTQLGFMEAYSKVFLAEQLQTVSSFLAA